MAAIFDKALDQIQSAGRKSRLIATSLSETERPIGFQSTCQRCGDLVEWKQVGIAPRLLRFWSDCTCWLMECERMGNLGKNVQPSDYRVERIESDVRQYQGFTLDTFDATRLAGGDRLLAIVQGWLEAITPLSVASGYDSKPRCCLYFYSPGKGRGKTHLAAALAMQAKAAGKLISIVDEISYVESYWAASLESRATIASLPAEKAWLTVFDDMGSRENTPAGLRDCWYDLIGPRWLKRGWTIVTSNWTLEELVERGTIDDRVYSRLYQMTGGKIVTFDGADYRLQGGVE